MCRLTQVTRIKCKKYYVKVQLFLRDVPLTCKEGDTSSPAFDVHKFTTRLIVFLFCLVRRKHGTAHTNNWRGTGRRPIGDATGRPFQAPQTSLSQPVNQCPVNQSLFGDWSPGEPDSIAVTPVVAESPTPERSAFSVDGTASRSPLTPVSELDPCIGARCCAAPLCPLVRGWSAPGLMVAAGRGVDAVPDPPASDTQHHAGPKDAARPHVSQDRCQM